MVEDGDTVRFLQFFSFGFQPAASPLCTSISPILAFCRQGHSYGKLGARILSSGLLSGPTTVESTRIIALRVLCRVVDTAFLPWSFRT